MKKAVVQKMDGGFLQNVLGMNQFYQIPAKSIVEI